MAIVTNTTILSECPGFSAEIFILLPSSWYSAMFWTWDVNNADKTLIFFIACTEPETFHLPVPLWQ